MIELLIGRQRWLNRREGGILFTARVDGDTRAERAGSEHAVDNHSSSHDRQFFYLLPGTIVFIAYFSPRFATI